MRQFGRTAASRAALLALVFALVPACGNKNESGSPPPSSGSTGGSGGSGGSGSGPTTLFSEDFGGAFPGTAWTSPSGTGTGWSADISKDVGNASPSLAMTTTMGPAFVQTESNTVIMKAPFTVSVQVAVLAEGEGSGAMDILNSTQTPMAAVEWHPVSVGGAVTFMIADPTAPATPHVMGLVPPAPGPTFHTFTFSVDASGNATWTMDGGSPVLAASGFPTSGPFVMRLYDNIQAVAGPFATFYFDNVKITIP